MKPLEATEIDAIDLTATARERGWKRIPLVGWFVADKMWYARVNPIAEKIVAQLLSRPKPESAVWGSEARAAVAQYVCKLAMEQMGWPNNHFIPDDPVAVVFWAHEDGLDFEAAYMEIEEHLGVVLTDAEVNRWPTQTLGEVVDFLLTRKKALTPQIGVWPPAPKPQGD